MKKIFFIISILATASAQAQNVRLIKVATLAPEGSPWAKGIQAMNEALVQSDAPVRYQLHAGKTLGEGIIKSKLQNNQYQAAVLTVATIQEIAKDAAIPLLPMLIQSDEEFEKAMSVLGPVLARQLKNAEDFSAANGLTPLSWGKLGIARFFCRNPYRSFAEIKQANGGTGARLFVPKEADAVKQEEEEAAAWRKAGFEPAFVTSTSIPALLKEGKLDCFTLPPIYTKAYGYYKYAPYMIGNVLWTYISGGMVARNDVYDNLPGGPETQKKLLEAAKQGDVAIRNQLNAQEEIDLQEMKKNGLQIIEVQDLPAWRGAAQVLRDAALEKKTVDAALYKKVVEVLEPKAEPPAPAPPAPKNVEKPAKKK